MRKHKNLAVDEIKEMIPLFLIFNGILLAGIITISIINGFDFRLYSGLVVGNVLMAANFLLIGVTAGAISRTRSFKRGQFLGNFSYGLRYIGIFVILALLLTFDLISPFTAVIPLFFPRIFYTVQAFRGKYDDE